MSGLLFIITTLLLPLAVAITYYDVRYRRIPNRLVLAALMSGLLTNSVFGGFTGACSSLKGCALAFILMLVLHLVGQLGAGDVKLFAAIGAMIGYEAVLPTFFTVLIVGGLVALCLSIWAGTLRTTMHGVLQVFVGLLPGWQMPHLSVPADRRLTVPYGVAITFGSLISLFLFQI